MRYADPSANRDLLGNRTLLFIFICAFALVTLLQQILYSRSYIKRYFEFYKGPLEFNSTRCLELRQEILDVKVLSMVKQSELFDRWKRLQICNWAMDTSEANLFKYALLSAFRPHGVGPHCHLSRYPPLVLSGHLSGAGPKGPDVSSGKASTYLVS
ncbi:alpha-2,8-sialyltransferase 8E-like isoform X2 [Microtus oregoni]|uniref:alpha-2,8-sialyltransferase 8E-like isoform X2 n=1 Tax=Microtus oregoni TaxID=111838 RepID=UPI001BB1A956|nr:alpha-2,8-sialyltransferase 8E-like isoform X2 [Microtus oregoni]